MDARALRADLPVEYCRRNDGDGLRRGHPGRVTDPRPEDVFVEWFGLEGAAVSRWVAFDLPALGVLDEDTFERRSDRLRNGLPPLSE